MLREWGHFTVLYGCQVLSTLPAILKVSGECRFFHLVKSLDHMEAQEPWQLPLLSKWCLLPTSFQTLLWRDMEEYGERKVLFFCWIRWVHWPPLGLQVGLKDSAVCKALSLAVSPVVWAATVCPHIVLQSWCILQLLAVWVRCYICTCCCAVCTFYAAPQHPSTIFKISTTNFSVILPWECSSSTFFSFSFPII